MEDGGGGTAKYLSGPWTSNLQIKSTAKLGQKEPSLGKEFFVR